VAAGRWLAEYAREGGHLVIGPRAAYADHEGRARHESAPGRLAEAAGVRYDEFSNLRADIPLRTPTESDLVLPREARGTRWVDGLTVTDAQILATYHHPHFGQWPAITTRAHGAGRVTTVGTVPDRALAQALAAWLAPNPRSGWPDLPETVTATTATATDGRRVHVLHNWSWNPTRLTAPHPLHDVLNGGHTAVGAPLRLGPWDVRVLLTDDRPASPSSHRPTPSASRWTPAP
jgi:beta-galactosidase